MPVKHAMEGAVKFLYRGIALFTQRRGARTLFAYSASTFETAKGVD